MEIITPKKMQQIDQIAVEKYGIPSILLMEHAAYQVFLTLKDEVQQHKIVIVCGPGNNGGDGLALARQIYQWQTHTVIVIMAAPFHQLSQDGQIYATICKNLNIPIIEVDEQTIGKAVQKIEEASIVIDALFGTGISRPIEGKFKILVDAINQQEGRVISIDIPSGINGETGKIFGVCVHADETVTFVRPKLGLYLYPGILYTGEVRVVNIGIPEQLLQEVEVQHYAIEKNEMPHLLPQRAVRSNKGSFGKVLTIGGSLGMAGAITLTSKAAYKVGCGTVTCAVPECIIEIIQQKLTEVMVLGLEAEEGHFSEKASIQLNSLLSSYQVIAIGPGMKRNKKTSEMVYIVLKSDLPCVLDADALYFLAEMKELLKERVAPTIITPHPGEMAHLIGVSIEQILEDPIQYAQEFSRQYGVITVLKLEKTVIADRNGVIYINRYGNSGLAKGGSGDTLTGIIAGLLGQHARPIDAAILGVYLQTRAADIAKHKLSEYSFLASDVIHYLGETFLELISMK